MGDDLPVAAETAGGFPWALVERGSNGCDVKPRRVVGVQWTVISEERRGVVSGEGFVVSEGFGPSSLTTDL
jgi:hypothetical protein